MNSDEINKSIKEKIDLITDDENCLIKVVKEIEKKFNHLNHTGERRLIVLIMDYLGYKTLNNKNDIEFNEQILSLVYPRVNFSLIALTYSKNVAMQLEFLNKIESQIDLLIDENLTKLSDISNIN